MENKILVERIQAESKFQCKITAEYFGEKISVISKPAVMFSIAESKAWKLFLEKIGIQLSTNQILKQQKTFKNEKEI